MVRTPHKGASLKGDMGPYMDCIGGSLGVPSMGPLLLHRGRSSEGII